MKWLERILLPQISERIEHLEREVKYLEGEVRRLSTENLRLGNILNVKLKK